MLDPRGLEMPLRLRQCAILAGGLGTRLGALARGTPKPLLDVGDRPFLAWIMREAVKWGIDRFVLLTGHLGDQVEARTAELGAAVPLAVEIQVSNELASAGTGGALYYARGMLERRFLLLNGDSLFLTDLRPALAQFALDDDGTACRMVLRALADTGRYGVASLDSDKVVTFKERPSVAGPGLINSGIYLMDHLVAEQASPSCSLERDLLPALIGAGLVRGTVADGWFIDIGIPADLERARTELPHRMGLPRSSSDYADV